ncbi:hypothetical protein [Mycolicibacterium conceptionense]|uniref:hypothetical protein n=1 Tax=Mycolicibacterium conceptionense TaxID=451644 RepID=UPI0007EDA9AE|nr:hypothetical protein [Mycolicibacterium conceptionense]OBJ91187.1 hypothetical protein A5639_10740 [Mycolicibacterium conceptionense]
MFGGFALALVVGGLVTAYLTFSKPDSGDSAAGLERRHHALLLGGHLRADPIRRTLHRYLSSGDSLRAATRGVNRMN